MSFATLVNIATIMFCTAVLVQSVRMMRGLQAVKQSGLAEMIVALDRATIQAKTVLDQLKETLRNDCAANARKVDEGAAIRDELSILIGIGDATAERIMEAAGAAKAAAAAPVDTPADAVPVAPPPARARTRKPSRKAEAAA